MLSEVHPILSELSGYGYVTIGALSLLVNLIPFTSPSNLILAAVFVTVFPSLSPALVGLVVALAASVGKSGHFFTGNLIGRIVKSRSRILHQYSQKVGKWGFVGTFIVAATPIPDDPLVIPLGILKYNFAKFFLAYFLGKLLITEFGAYTAGYVTPTFEALFGNNYLTIAVALTVVLVTSALLKFDLQQLFNRLRAGLSKEKQA